MVFGGLLIIAAVVSLEVLHIFGRQVAVIFLSLLTLTVLLIKL